MKAVYDNARTVNGVCRAVLRNIELLEKFKAYLFIKILSSSNDEEFAMEAMFDVVGLVTTLSKISTLNLNQDCLNDKDYVLVRPTKNITKFGKFRLRNCEILGSKMPSGIEDIASYKLIHHDYIDYPIALSEALNFLLSGRKPPQFEPNDFDENEVVAKCKADFTKYYMKRGRTNIKKWK